MPTWVRCKDKDNGHEYDLSPSDTRVLKGLVEVLKKYPENTGSTARPRPAKHRVTKSGRAVKAAEQSASPEMSEEQEHGAA